MSGVLYSQLYDYLKLLRSALNACEELGTIIEKRLNEME
jgi:hypothetical protein